MATGLNNWGIGFIFSYRNLATPGFKMIDNELTKIADISKISEERMASLFKTMGVGAGIAAGGLVSLKIFKNLADAAGEFEYEMAFLRQVTKASDETFEDLRKSAFNAGLSMTQFSPLDAAQGLRIFAQAGFSARDAMNALVPTLDMAAASFGQLGLEQAAQLAVTGLKLFNIESENTAYLMDRLAQATIMSSMQFKELPLALGVVSRGVLATNASLEDTLIGLGLVRNIIVTTERASTAFATSLEKLATEKSLKSIEKLGIAVEDLEKGGFRPVLDIIGELSVELSQMDPLQNKLWVSAVFGKRSMAGLLAMYRQLTTAAEKFGGVTRENMIKVLDEMRQKMDNAGGAASKLRDAQLNTWKGQKQVIGAQISGLWQAMGEGFAAAFKPVANSMALFVNWLAKAFASLPIGLKSAISGTLAFIGVITTLIGVGVGLTALISFIAATAGTAVLTVAAVIATIGVGVGFIAAEVGALYLLWSKNFIGIRTVTMALLQPIIDVTDAIIQLFSTGGYMSDDLYVRLKNSPFFGFVKAVYMWGSRLFAFFQGFGITMGEVFGMWSEWFAPITEEFGEIFAAIGGMISELINVFVDLFGLEGPAGMTADWRTAGAVIANIVGVIGNIVTVLVGFILVPLFKTLSTLIRAVTALLVPFIKIMYYLGKVILKVLFFPITLLTGGWKGLIEDIKMVLVQLLTFLVQIGKNLAAAALAPIMAIVTKLPKRFRPSWMEDIITWYGKLLTVGDTEKDIKALFGMPIEEKKPIEKPLGGIAKEIRERKMRAGPKSTVAMTADGRLVMQPAASVKEYATSGAVGNAPITIEHTTQLYVDGRMIRSTIQKSEADSKKRAGQSTSSTGFGVTNTNNRFFSWQSR